MERCSKSAAIVNPGYGEARHLGAKSTKYEPPSSPAMRAQYAVDAKIDVGRTPITTEFVTINPIRRHAFRGTPDHSRDPRPAHSAQRRRLTSSIAEHQKTSEGHHVAGAASQNRTVQSACQGIYVEFIFPRRSPSGEAFDEEAPLRTRSDQRSQKRAALSAEAETCLGEKPRRHDVRSRKPPIVPKRTSPISEATTTERGHVRESITTPISRR